MCLGIQDVLTIRTSKSCVVAHFRVADTPIFGVSQRIHSIDLFFQEGYIMYFEAQIPTRRFFFLQCEQRCSIKSRERESRIRTEQKSTMGVRPLDESAPSRD